MGFTGGAAGVMQPGNREAVAAAPEARRKSRRLRLLMPLSRLLGGKVGGDRLDLIVAIAPGDLMHDRRRPLAGLEIADLLRELRAPAAGEAGHARLAHSVRSMAAGAGRGEIAPGSGVRILRESGRNERECKNEERAAHAIRGTGPRPVFRLP